MSAEQPSGGLKLSTTLSGNNTKISKSETRGCDHNTQQVYNKRFEPVGNSLVSTDKPLVSGAQIIENLGASALGCIQQKNIISPDIGGARNDPLFQKDGKTTLPSKLFNNVPENIMTLAREADVLVGQNGNRPIDLPPNLRAAYFGTILSVKPDLIGGLDIIDKYPEIATMFPKLRSAIVNSELNKQSLTKTYPPELFGIITRWVGDIDLRIQTGSVFPSKQLNSIPKEILEKAGEAAHQVETKHVRPTDLPAHLRDAYYGIVLLVSPGPVGGVSLLNKYPGILTMFPNIRLDIADIANRQKAYNKELYERVNADPLGKMVDKMIESVTKNYKNGFYW